MKSLQLLLAISVLAVFNSSAYAKDYYVCDNGNDAGFGETKEKPFKTFDKAMSNFSSMKAGDSISFCRGGSFTVSNYKALFNTNFTAENPGRIGDYFAPGSAGEEQRPIITNQNDGVFYFNTRNVLVPDGGLLIENLILMGGGESRGIFFLNGYSDVQMKNLLIDGFRVGVSIGGGAKESNNVIFRNSIVQNNLDQGWLGGGSNLLIEDNYFQNNGFGGKNTSYFYHNVYVSNPADIPSNNVIIRGNTLYQSAMFEGKCGGAPMVVHGKLNHLLIENNIIKEDKGAVSQYCYGMGVGPAYSKAEVFNDVTIRNNKIINAGRVGISGGSLVNAVIENNYIVDEGSILHEGILVPEDGKSNDAKSRNVVIKGNTIITNHHNARGISIGGDFPFVVEGNTISIHSGSENGKCFKKVGANSNTNTGNNTCKTHTKVNINIKADLSRFEENSQKAENQARADAQAIAETQAIAKYQAIAEVQAKTEAQTRAEAQVREAAKEAAETAALAARAQAAAIQAQKAGEKKRATQAAVQAQAAAQAAAQAQGAAQAKVTAQAVVTQLGAGGGSATPKTKADDSKQENLDANIDERQTVKLGGSSSGAGGGWSTSSATVTHSDVVYGESSDAEASNEGYCRASARGRCLLK